MYNITRSSDAHDSLTNDFRCAGLVLILNTNPLFENGIKFVGARAVRLHPFIILGHPTGMQIDIVLNYRQKI